MAVLTRESALAARRTKTTAVEVPELGGEILIRRLNALQVETLSPLFVTGEADLGKNLKLACALIATAVVDESGTPLFATPEEVGEYEIDVVMKLATAVAEVAGLTGGDTAGK